ncbi:NAD(P)H-dependent oxidoreductase [Nioella aestuarii]|uniref:NAD(P)H-dependent oxidoreductase n=1 Tax=Nioella aestuarii TaxID=1662864 RepID=UPI003D7F1BD0
MTTTLIVLAHPDPGSFNGAWAEASARACRKLGHEVLVSDLCAMGFDAVEGRRHFPTYAEDRAFDPLKAQEEAAGAGTIPADVAAEIGKLTRADLVILHFPIWWFAPPAVLKGWFDRVLLHGRLHTVDQRFDTGMFRGKRALFCVTTGASAAESGHDGKEGDIHLLLWPMAQTLRYLGFTVLQPEAVHGVHGYFEGVEEQALRARLGAVLDGQADLIAGLEKRPEIAFNADADFDADGRLKPDSPSHSPFIRHRP